jgi:hypothetical protein
MNGAFNPEILNMRITQRELATIKPYENNPRPLRRNGVLARPAMREDERCDVTVRGTGLQTERAAL